MAPNPIRLKRAYAPPGPEDGARFLVDRLWPRGLSKERLHLDAWLKDVAPSTDLRHFYDHRPERWAEFTQRYRAELSDNGDALAPLLEAARQGTVTLIYAAKDPEHNNAQVLKEHLEAVLAPTRR
jgi:uncharacterized protein YeaO (DUF488 family)